MTVPESRVVASIAQSDFIKSARPGKVDGDMVVAYIDGVVNIDTLERNHVPEGWSVENVAVQVSGMTVQLFPER